MSTSIPFDPSLVLGQIFDYRKLERLMEIAEVQKPCILANDKLNSLITQSYKMDMILKQMQILGLEWSQTKKVVAKIAELKKRMAEAAISLVRETIKCEQGVQKLQMEASGIISLNIESPIDYDSVQVKNFPLSYDAVKFDVQYVRNESSVDDSNSHANSVAKTVGKSFGIIGIFNAKRDTTDTIADTIQRDNSRYEIEGTIVVTAHVQHRNAEVLEPFNIDPKKAVKAWNSTFPDDRLYTDPQSMLEAATLPVEVKGEKYNCLNLLSGCSKSSSFVGYINLKKSEDTSSTQMSSSFASAAKTSITLGNFIASVTATSGYSEQAANMSKNLFSSSQLNNSVGIVSQGIIPKFVADDISTTVYSLKPNPSEVMNNLKAIQGASNEPTNQGMSAQAGSGKSGKQYVSLQSDFISSSVETLAPIQNEKNKVINTNTMFTALTDFIEKAISGRSGVPTNFFIKKITKDQIAKRYIGKFYPYGARGKQGIRGELEQEPTE
mmetsp:Transcript_14416/g.22224  ORF Transcript_14416/g.22224 Transcript_14416/m.22224 type:complete len:495 (-) Transcript_14416:147-1631(-)|eukprot:CAMPEP_0194259534 /NCGR_PEP_ID=MMETSP0158-20130606/43802_1 /TAXON_ID=33649 /ORGANISM="Thalassionema nitzschioides, Strain L26-B" /LENGTH=494 /DNA_ID=CAMNT_0038999363 /DNA_START=39 /DNA_END=1523 /DNA_ORIENTATION=+